MSLATQAKGVYALFRTIIKMYKQNRSLYHVIKKGQ